MTELIQPSEIITITPDTSILEVLPQLVSQRDQYVIYQIDQQGDSTFLTPTLIDPSDSDRLAYYTENTGSPAIAVLNRTNEQTGLTVTELSNTINRNLKVEADPWFLTILTNADGAQFLYFRDNQQLNPNATIVTQDEYGQVSANVNCPLESGEPVTYRYQGGINFARIKLVDMLKSNKVIYNPVEMAQIIQIQLTQSPDLDRYMLARLTNQPNPYQYLNLINHQTD